MVEQLNRLISRFRVKIVDIKPQLIVVNFPGWKQFLLFNDGGVLEQENGKVISSASSKWVEGVSKGLKRDDKGNFIAVTKQNQS